jgi:hypothetical protein
MTPHPILAKPGSIPSIRIVACLLLYLCVSAVARNANICQTETNIGVFRELLQNNQGFRDLRHPEHLWIISPKYDISGANRGRFDLQIAQ